MRWFLTLALAGGLLLASFAQAGDAIKADQDRFQGTWQLVSVEINKEPVPLENLKVDKVVVVGKLVIKGNEYTFYLGKNKLELSFKMFPDRTPRAIDLTILSGAQKGKVYHGIYKLEGDTYTICRHTEPGKARPTEFATQPESGLMLNSYKRQKGG
jgi:uncharacterized protein (TIGR03067 family)